MPGTFVLLSQLMVHWSYVKRSMMGHFDYALTTGRLTRSLSRTSTPLLASMDQVGDARYFTKLDLRSDVTKYA